MTDTSKALEIARSLGKTIYDEALQDRRGFAYRQLQIDEDIWAEIYTAICSASLKAVAPLIAAQARNEALDEAAGLCGWHSTRQHAEGTPETDQISYSYAARDCQSAILGLKSNVEEKQA